MTGASTRTTDAVYNFPTLSELYKYAAYDGLGKLARMETFLGGRENTAGFIAPPPVAEPEAP